MGEGAVAVVVAFAVVAVRDEAWWSIAVAVVVGQVAFVVDEARVWSGSLSKWVSCQNCAVVRGDGL